MEKKKLLKRLSALGFAMYECRLYCDTHPNDTEALQMLNDYKSKYEAVKAEFAKPRAESLFKSFFFSIILPSCLKTVYQELERACLR